VYRAVARIGVAIDRGGEGLVRREWKAEDRAASEQEDARLVLALGAASAHFVLPQQQLEPKDVDGPQLVQTLPAVEGRRQTDPPFPSAGLAQAAAQAAGQQRAQRARKPRR
jgi:hypothetical protein